MRIGRLSRTIIATVALSLVTTVTYAQDKCGGKDLLLDLKAQQPEKFAALAKASEAVENGQGLLWRVEPPDQKDGKTRLPSYIFGTIHISDPRVALTPKVSAALDASPRLALELDDVSPRRMRAAIEGLRNEIVLPAGQTLATVLDKPELDRLADILVKRGLPRAAADKFRPWFAYLMSGIPACEASRIANGHKSLDATIYANAERKGRGVIGLETPEAQFKSLSTLPDADQGAILKAHAKKLDQLDDSLETMVQMYLRQDTGTMMAHMRVSMVELGVSQEASDRFELQFVTQRNRVMRDRALLHINRGGVFVAVGALHLPGKNGLIAMFKEMGYTVTRVETAGS